MVNGLTANTEPGAALAGFSESLLAVTLIFLPSCIKNAIGHGFIPRTQLWMWAAGWVKSNCAISLVRDGALVARDSSCFFGVSFPASILGRTSTSVLAPIALTRSNSSPLVMSGSIATGCTYKISPVSNPSSNCIIVTPVSASPLSTAHWIGAEPRYLGNSETCRLMQPYLATCKSCGGIMQP